MLGCWGAFLGLIPPVFLTDEIEGIDPKDMLYAGAIGIVGLVVPIITVPTATGTVMKEWSDRALDVYRHNLRENRPAVEQATARVADYFHQRGLSGAGPPAGDEPGPRQLRDARERRPRFPQRPAVPQPDDARHRPGGRDPAGPGGEGIAGAARVGLHLMHGRRSGGRHGTMHQRPRSRSCSLIAATSVRAQAAIEGRVLARGARLRAGEGGYRRCGSLSVRADGALAPPALSARQDPRGPDPRAVVEPVVLGPDDRRTWRPMRPSATVISSGPSATRQATRCPIRPRCCAATWMRCGGSSTPIARMRPSTGWSSSAIAWAAC